MSHPTRLWEMTQRAEKAEAEVERLREALNDYAQPSSWGMVVTSSGERRPIYLTLVEPPWQRAADALAGCVPGSPPEEQQP
jgi:hypothetical protein